MFRETIYYKRIKQDKWGKEYLVLELEKQKDIFVFANQVNRNKWDELQVGQTYEFAVREGKNKNNFLISYKIIKLTAEVINQIKKFPHSHDNYYYNLTPEQESLVDELITNRELRERYKKYGLCRDCQQPNTYDGADYDHFWCQSCNAQCFAWNFKNWTSGNKIVDKFIQKQQIKSTNKYGILEWIPHEQFSNIEYLAEGGFGKVYKANWVNEPIDFWGVTGWRRENNNEKGRKVVLKILKNSQDMSADFLQEIINHKLVENGNEGDGYIARFYGLSQDPETKNFVMVMEHMRDGDLRQYSKENLSSTKKWNSTFYGELHRLLTVVFGLNCIHKKGLVHRDLHAGNILNRYPQCFITDFGLSRPANESDKGKIYGVLPYVSPEVLRGKPYTQASDIYSFGIIVYELFSGLPPYVVYDEELKVYKEKPHNVFLALYVCSGLRPNLDDIRTPQLLKDLISQCWDADPEKRPIVSELCNILSGWLGELAKKKNTEFYQQVMSFPESNSMPLSYQTHSQAIYTSRLLDFKNLPNPQNSKKINEQFYGSKDIELDINDFNLNELSFQDIQAQIQIP